MFSFALTAGLEGSLVAGGISTGFGLSSFEGKIGYGLEILFSFSTAAVLEGSLDARGFSTGFLLSSF